MKNSVYTRGFPSSFTKENLSTVFRAFGEVRRVKLISEENKLYAIIKYFKKEHAQNAIDNLHGKTIDDIQWYVNFSEGNVHEKYQRLCRERERTIILRDFPESFTEKAAKWIFDQHGVVKFVQIRLPYCFVTFETPEEAQQAVKKQKYLVFEGQRVYVALLMNKDELSVMIQKKKGKLNYSQQFFEDIFIETSL